ncbi:indole-diterpene biosynthesis protein PaxU [Hirsutella rhossiliensis]|uniref:Indole-diterpene biosynthesis protein PaxU n=1 Tax=Hirsutella rhossiliensis TaxID=111463 RepID=A0A9P8N794_9HYPO|nr:indole-diterpene biosynthesis protein PaxU [Hirsutella rhossiliensis]KAH0968282.1 indole-diterpene biosynthesis protein PaxU [Hirsutella rhossiliensis]
MPPSAARAGPLAFMQALSPTVAYWDPRQRLHPRSQSPSPPSSKDPELILLLSWMAARDEHIAKYIAQHQALFPSSRILLIRCPLLRVWLPWIARRDVKPALLLLRALAKGGDGQDDEGTCPRVLVHMFSNGGISTAVHLRSMLLAAGLDDGGRGIAALPRYVLLLDSCPGYFRWRNTHRALVQTLPWWVSPLMHIAIAVACVYHSLRRLPPAQNQNAQALRAPRLVSRECRRTYLYGTADNMVDYQDVEDNARKAEEVGFVVRRERFEGAKHVAIARAEPARYWGAVRESWEGARATSDELKVEGV